MIKLIIFDLDGVLVTTKQIHFEALNTALNGLGYKPIEYNEHLERFDGLPTKTKLNILLSESRIKESDIDNIWKLKQASTGHLLSHMTAYDKRLQKVLAKLKDSGYRLFVASNAIKETCNVLLFYSGLKEYVEYLVSNEDVTFPKPNPQMYLKCMEIAGIGPAETLIIEDSPHGIQAAINSGAHVLTVKSPDEVTFEKIMFRINSMSSKKMIYFDNLNVLIPMAGDGQRFVDKGYSFPKPLIDIYGKPMIQVVVESLGIEANYIYIVRKEHMDKYNLKTLLSLITPNCTIIPVNEKTEGAACTALLAKKYIDDKQLLIANSDQYIEYNPLQLYYQIIEKKVDGAILTFNATHPKWSFVTVYNDLITRVAEKNPISNIATCGIYYFKNGNEFIHYAEQMINKNIRVNNEFYIAPVYNEAITDKKKIMPFFVDKMCGLGTPEDLELFMQTNKYRIVSGSSRAEVSEY